MRCEEADGLIEAFVEDALDRATRSVFAAHLDACARCRDAVEHSRRLSAALTRLPSAAPSPAADARALAAVEEEMAWARRRVLGRRVLVGLSIAAAAAVVLFLVFISTPASATVDGAASNILRLADKWLRLRAIPAVLEARGTIVAAFALFVVVALIDRLMSRRPNHRAAGA